MKHHESPASEPQPGRLQQITRVARNNIGMLAIGTAVVGGAAYNIQKAKQLEVIEIGGVHFKLSEDWEKVYEVTGLDEGQVKEAIEGHMNKLGDFIDPPVGSTVTVTPSSDINDVVVSIRYDKEVWEEKRRFIAKEVYSGEEIHLNPNHLNESTTYHELVHMARVGSGTFVMNNSFEEGLAEYGEMRAYPTKGEKPEIYTFIDHFPQLRELSVDDPKLGSRILNERTGSTPDGVIQLKHELRRRAWARFMDDPEHPERKDFVKRLQRAQKETPQDVWSTQALLELGNKLDPGFKEWFESEAIFRSATEREEAMALVKDNLISVLAFQIKKYDKKHPNEPDEFEMKPISGRGIIAIKLKDGRIMEIDITSSSKGIIQKLHLNKLLKLAGATTKDISDIGIFVGNGTKAAIKVL